MPWRIVLSRIARNDLDELWLQIAASDPDAADRHLDRLGQGLTRLSEFPRLGRDRGDLAAGLRGWVQGHSIILYKLNDEKRTVEVVRLVDGRRDLAALFQTGSGG